MRTALVIRLVVAFSFLAVVAVPAIAQNPVSRSQVDALLRAYEGVDAMQWRGLGNAAAPILESIALDQHELPTRRARAVDGLAALGSGESTMRALANSTTAPLIVRMSAIRGLGQVVPEASLIEALRPLLQDAQSQVRGIAAETLANTPSGCTVIRDMAQRETDAWRLRFTHTCTNPASPATPVPNLSGGDPTSRVIAYKIKDPNATVVYNYANITNPMKVAVPSVLGAVAVLVPNSPQLSFLTGSWTFQPLASKATTADFNAMIKTPSSASFTSGTLNANLFFVGVPGLTADSARLDPNFQSMLATVNSTYAQIGLQLGNLTYIDITGPDATTYTDVADTAALGNMMKLSADPQAADGAVNLFFVHSISGGSPGFIILGESAGIPGVPVRGSSQSGVAVTMADYPNGLPDLSAVIAHETGHWLGLFHTTESGGTSFDPLADTPQCPKATYDTNADNIVDATECASVDGPNLMFWTGIAGQPNTLMTSDQQFVLLRNPMVDVPGTQVTLAPLGLWSVPTAALSLTLNVNVPADGASFSFYGVVPETLNVHNRIYVNRSAVGANDGTSWNDAFTDLQSALAQPNSQIWVARGVYKPTATTDRSIKFNIPPNTVVYGGFAGTETQLSERDIAANPTVLSGDIDNNDTVDAQGIDADATHIVGNNSYNVVLMDGTTALGTITSTTVLDGVVITGGQATGASYPNNEGGGLHCSGQYAHDCSPTLTNIHFSGNTSTSGGALFNDGYGGHSSPTLRNVTFSGNRGEGDTAAMYNFGESGGDSSPVLVNVTFSGNTGGAIVNDGGGGQSSPKLSFVTFSGNTDSTCGGALYNYGVSNPSLDHVILWGDSGTPYAEICNDTGSNTTVTNSIAQGSGGSGGGWNPSFGTDGGGNLDADPKLGPLQHNGTFTPTMLLHVGSAAIDAATDCNDASAQGVASDQRGVSRARGTKCDIGAVEVTAIEIDRIFADTFGPWAPGPGSDYDPAHCQAVANTLNIFWQGLNGAYVGCSGIENTNGSAPVPSTAFFSMNGVSITPVTGSCLGTGKYAFTLSADKRTLIGADTLSGIPMTLTRSSDGACFVGYWVSGGDNFSATIWNFAGP